MPSFSAVGSRACLRTHSFVHQSGSHGRLSPILVVSTGSRVPGAVTRALRTAILTLDPGDCTVREPDYYVIGALNVISDLAVMAIPMPLLWKVSIPLTRKLMLGSIFALGFFVIIATILRAYYSLVSLDTLPVALGWASRETFFATLAATAPGIKPLFSKSGWVRATSHGQSYGYGRNDKYHGFSDPSQPGSTAVHVSADTGAGPSNEPHRYEMGHWARSQGRGRKDSCGASDEKSIIDDHKSEKKDFDRDIFVTQEYEVNRFDPGDRF